MNKQQLNWAKQHDWFVGYGKEFIEPCNTYAIYVRGDLSNDTMIFTDFNKLVIWAGY